MGHPVSAEELPADLGDTLTYLREQCDKRTWNIIELKFRDKMVLREIAAVVGVSRERCRQLLMKQAWRMKHYYQDVAKYGIGQAMEMQQKGEIDLSVHALRVPAAAASRAVKCGFNTISQLTSVTITEIKMTPRLKNGIASVLAQGLAEWGLSFLKKDTPVSDNSVLQIKIVDLDLCWRAKTAMFKNNIMTLGDLITKTSDDLLALRGVGIVALNEIYPELRKYGLQIDGMAA